MRALIFLDFDGVLRRSTSNPSRFDADCLSYFESTMRLYPHVQIVITSTWRLAMSLEELRGRFSPDVAVRIVGITPENLEEESYQRYTEIKEFLDERNLADVCWLAIDDDAAYFPKHCSLLLTDAKVGFDAECAVQLASILESFD